MYEMETKASNKLPSQRTSKSMLEIHESTHRRVHGD